MTLPYHVGFFQSLVCVSHKTLKLFLFLVPSDKQSKKRIMEFSFWVNVSALADNIANPYLDSRPEQRTKKQHFHGNH